MTLIAIVVGLSAVLISAALLLRRPAPPSPAVDDLRGDLRQLRETVQNIHTVFSGQLQTVTGNVQASLGGVTADLGGRLDNINRQVTVDVPANETVRKKFEFPVPQ